MGSFKRYLGGLVSAAVLLGCGASAEIPANDVDAAMTVVAEAVAKARETSGPGEPTIWTLSDEDTTVYLFGTVHILRPETDWRSPAFDAAFSEAGKLILETDAVSAEGLQKAQQLAVRYGVFADGTALEDYLDEDELATVEAALASVGGSVAGMGPAKPWLVNLQLSLAQIQASGYDPESGLEGILAAEAVDAGKSFEFLETLEEQFDVLAGGSVELQVDQLVFAAQTLDQGAALLDTLVEEWVDGDISGLGHIVAEPEVFGGVESYEALLVNRNRNWIPKISALLDEPGTVFIAVGAAHLAGPDSVINLLRAEGFTVTTP